MAGKVSTRTFETEGYSPEEWLPYLEPLSKRREYEKTWREDTSLKDYLNHPDNQTGGNLSYKWTDPREDESGHSANVYFQYSPYMRSQHGLMLTGDILINPDWAYFSRQQDDYSFLREYAEKYLKDQIPNAEYIHLVETEDDELDIVRIEIPESASEEDVSSTWGELSATIALVARDVKESYKERYGEEVEEKEEGETTRDLLE